MGITPTSALTKAAPLCRVVVARPDGPVRATRIKPTPVVKPPMGVAPRISPTLPRRRASRVQEVITRGREVAGVTVVLRPIPSAPAPSFAVGTP